MTTPVSVIITCYNLQDYIGSAIQSVLNQDYSGQVEVIVVDDNSSDCSNQVISSFSQVIHIPLQSNQGVLNATIAGIQASSHTLLFFLDGDDIWRSTKLSSIVPKFHSDSRLALVTHDLNFIDAKGRLLNKQTRSSRVMSEHLSSDYPKLTLDGILHHHDYVWLGSAYAVHRDLANVSGFISFIKSTPDPNNTYQDWTLAFWAACQPGISVDYVPTKLFSYRLHGVNHSGDSSTLAKASRNFRRSKNTIHCIYLISILYHVKPSVQKSIRTRLTYYKYLDDLYSPTPLKATMGFLSCIPYFSFLSVSPVKEFIRFSLIQLLGAQNFINITNALRFRTQTTSNSRS